MKVLDCEDENTMFGSIREITGVGENELLNMFNEFNLDYFYEVTADYPYRPAELFLLRLKKMSNLKRFNFDKTNWFHLTRVVPGTKFDNGLLPLGQNLDYIWDLLFRLQKGFLSKLEWGKFKCFLESNSQFESAFQYRVKYKDDFHYGPYAMLIRDVAFNSSEVGNHDYLEVPEIIEDICNSFYQMYQFDLVTKFKNSAVPCIVKFETTRSEEEYLGIVVNFLYHKHHKLRLIIDSNTCFDGENKAIPKDSILRVDYI